MYLAQMNLCIAAALRLHFESEPDCLLRGVQIDHLTKVCTHLLYHVAGPYNHTCSPHQGLYTSILPYGRPLQSNLLTSPGFVHTYSTIWRALVIKLALSSAQDFSHVGICVS